jgi:aminoglycoside 3-N-acetyltransferase
MWTKQDLTGHLKAAGLGNSDTVMVHSSLKSIGECEGGADGVIDTLISYFCGEGLLCMPALSYRDVSAEKPLFSVLSTPSCVGVIPELFRKRPGVVRSWHPTHSVCAMGRDAEVFTAGHEKFDSPGHRLSPWGRLYDRDAKILFIGTGIICNTYLHGVEEWFPSPGCLTDEKQALKTERPDGVIIDIPSRRHQGNRSRFYRKPEAIFLDRGALRKTSFGSAELCVLEARAAADIVTALLRKDPLIFTDERPLPPL